MKNFLASTKAKVLAVAGTLGLAPAVFAEDSPDAYTVPASVTSGLNQLKDAGGKLADAIVPVLVAVGIAFLGCWAAIAIFRYFKRAAGR